jgi:MFS superfamily sulfate permease-like transporter
VCINIFGVIVVLTALTKPLQYIPSAVLSSIIFVAIANLIHFSDFWHAWKYSKKDFITMFVTMTFVFVYETKIGLAIGLGTSVIVYLVFDIILAKSHDPRLFSSSKDGNDVDVVRIESDLNFLTAARVKDFIVTLTVMAPSSPDISNRAASLRFKIGKAFDTVLKPQLLVGVEKLPVAIVVDMCIVKTIDLSGLHALESAMKEVRSRGVLIAYINASPDIAHLLAEFGIRNDKSSPDFNFELYAEAYKVDLWTIESRRLAARKKTGSFNEIEDRCFKGSTFGETSLPTAGNIADKEYNRNGRGDHEPLSDNDPEVVAALESEGDGIEMSRV